MASFFIALGCLVYIASLVFVWYLGQERGENLSEGELFELEAERRQLLQSYSRLEATCASLARENSLLKEGRFRLKCVVSSLEPAEDTSKPTLKG